MPRLRQVSRQDAPPQVQAVYDVLFGERDPVAEPGTDTGTPGNWWTVFALVPDALQHALDGFAFYRSPKRVLDPLLRELGQTRTGYARGSTFVFSQHCKALRGLGVPDEKIAAVAAWQTSDAFTPAERAVLAYTDCLVLDGGRVPDAVFDSLRANLREEAILELTYIVCMYDMHATMCRALQLEFDERDDPVREIIVPGARTTLDMPTGPRGQNAPGT